MHDLTKIAAIIRRFRALNKPNSSADISSSDAFKYLKEQCVSIENQDIYQDIFGIISANLSDFDKDEHYFKFIEELIEFHKFDIFLITNQIFNMSLYGLHNDQLKVKFNLYINMISPYIISSIFLYRNISSFHYYLIIVDSLLRINEKYILPGYIDTLSSIIKIYSETDSRDYEFILCNYLDVLRLCAEFQGCDPEDAAYFLTLADFYDQMPKASE